MAIVTVSSFVNILLDQIVEKLSFKSTLRRTASFIESEKQSLEHYTELSFFKKLIEVLKSYSSFYVRNHESLSKYPEAELLGSLSGYVSSFEPNWTLSTNEKLEIGSSRAYIDLIVSDGQEKVIVELKRGRDYSAFYDHINTAEEQVKNYMSASGIECGIAFYTPVKTDDEIITSNEVGKEDSLVIIHSVPPGTIPTKEEIEEMDRAYDEFH